MGIYGFAILCILALLASFYAGVVLGISDTKRSYGIGKGVTPEEFDDWCKMLQDMAYEPFEEVDEDGTVCP